MAKKVITTTEFVDDVDGGKAEGTVSFAFEGVQYEIDLSKRNRSAFEKALKPYLDAGRKVSNRRKGRAGASARSARRDLSGVREWARSNGHEISDRGRIPDEIMSMYDAAH